MEQIELDFNTIDNTIPKDEQPQVFSVSDLNKLIRQTLENKFNLIWIKGEISNFKPHSSGHYYFSLKDQKSQINAIMFKANNQKLKFRPADGMEVLVRGKITVYEPRGNYQVFCEAMEPVGAGALQLAFEQLKKKLSLEGLFDRSRKRPLPAHPKHIAVVTSPTGAAIRDILNVLHRRFRGLKITVIPTVVQGEQATKSIVKAIELAQRINDIDAMIIGRGGGSIEDMWAFNTEPVARAIAASRVPTISAVGHEIDFTIADFVADLRAPTPSAAAELVVKSASELTNTLRQLLARCRNLKAHWLKIRRQRLDHLTRQLVDPRRRLQDTMLRLDELKSRLENAIQRSISDDRLRVTMLNSRFVSPREVVKLKSERLRFFRSQLEGALVALIKSQKNRIGTSAQVLDVLSPLKVVDRGYAIVAKENKIVRSKNDVSSGDVITIRVADGEFQAGVK